jgi:hypothetical protein
VRERSAGPAESSPGLSVEPAGAWTAWFHVKRD